MSTLIPTAPAFRVTAARGHLQRDRGHYAPESLSDFAIDAVLARLAAAMAPGRPEPTKADLAELVENAAKAAREQSWAAREQSWAETCACGHGWGEHVGRGCLECDDCRTPRPQREVSWTPTVLPTLAQVAQAYDADDRHFPQAGAR